MRQVQVMMATLSVMPAAQPAEPKDVPARVLLAQYPGVYPVLFRLACTRAAITVRAAAVHLLMLLPTEPTVHAELTRLLTPEPGPPPASTNMTHVSRALVEGSPVSLLYLLQVLDGLLRPANALCDVATATAHARRFQRLGGMRLLLDALRPERFARQRADATTCRGCFVSGIHLLQLMLFGNLAEPTPAPGLPRVAASPEGATATSGAIEEEEGSQARDGKGREGSAQDSHGARPGGSREERMTEDDMDALESPSDADMHLAVEMLQWVTWQVATGRLATIGGKDHAQGAAAAEMTTDGGDERDPGDGGGTGLSLPGDDVQLCKDALALLLALLETRPRVLEAWLQGGDLEVYLVDVLVRCGDVGVRDGLMRGLQRLAALRAPDAAAGSTPRAALLRVLRAPSARAEAEAEAAQCQEYFGLLTELLRGPFAESEELVVAQQALEEELRGLPVAPPAEEESDHRLTGRLTLIVTLLQALDGRGTSPPQTAGLVELLVHDMLFPEAAVVARERPIQVVDRAGVHARCRTKSSRCAAFDLLIELANQSVTNLQLLAELLMRLHYSERPEMCEWEHLPAYTPRPPGGFVGLRNAGATCYMNSVFQQIFMQPTIRGRMLAAPPPPDVEDAPRSESVFYQLQALMGGLLGSSQDHYSPHGFWQAFKDYDGQPVNVHEHQDAFEFFTRLQEQVDSHCTKEKQPGVLEPVIGGKFAQQIISRSCPHRSEREEDFSGLSVDVRNKRTLEESLSSYVQGDLLEGDNQYFCEGCKQKVDAVRRACIKALPHTLVVQLKRFEFDYNTMLQNKIKDRFEFPQRLDMRPFTVEGLAAKERIDSGSGAETSASPEAAAHSAAPTPELEPSRPDSYYEYELVGVVVHSGTAFAGHYYSYIRERDADAERRGAGAEGRGWHRFDDRLVEPYDLSQLERDCFGGKYVAEHWDASVGANVSQEYERPNSAYMLFYERREDSSAGGLQDEVMAVDTGSKVAKSAASGGATAEDGMLAQLPARMYETVMEENLRFVHESHLLDLDYLDFVWRLVDSCRGGTSCNRTSEDDDDARKMRRCCVGADTGSHKHTHLRSSGEGGGGSDGEMEGESSSGGAAGGAGAAGLEVGASLGDGRREVGIQVASEFLSAVYFRAHSTLREDTQRWKMTMQGLLEENARANRWFLGMLANRNATWLRQFLVKCPAQDVRTLFAHVVVHALRCAVAQGFGTPPTGPVEHVVVALVALLLECPGGRGCHSAALLWVVAEYARIGRAQRAHLLHHHALGALVGVLQRAYGEQVARLSLTGHELEHAHVCISLLMRQCTLAQVLERDEAVGKPNPYQMEGPKLPLPQAVNMRVLTGKHYLAVLLDVAKKEAVEHPEALRSAELLLKFCCWESGRYSAMVLQEVQERLYHAHTSDVLPVLHSLQGILLLPDELQRSRVQYVLATPPQQSSFQEGGGVRPVGVMNILTSGRTPPAKRYTIFKWMVGLIVGGQLPAMQEALGVYRMEWKAVVDWLSEDIAKYTLTDSPSVAGIEFDDSTGVGMGGHLAGGERERTLLNAREVWASLDGAPVDAP
ncbi:Ubiquitin carboxyl-terminal hydrolase 24 [Cymbomonas tetramitiformis]|uniref:Ubiquitin carboxyl-terminal hydrolase 24 n=1 Tax=Cymbomonas tetramitiformis TaxID=36881 RepID=A0AAE0FGK9_9CHLO|nr:Ubiquitin carboxyl-terminal hydrolase 24 [Cymbomonas tetramitiformis]